MPFVPLDSFPRVSAQEQANDQLRQDLNTALEAKAKIATLQSDIRKTQALAAEYGVTVNAIEKHLVWALVFLRFRVMPA